ncbi:MAG: Nif3-like dinuclear metal center hexameric protein [Coriobacteriia bacterium]|nr:Nif3-like dinuclear metal center hexameric protein [Coriobacteriia bacterium]
MSGATIADVVGVLEERFPSQWTEPWDAVGLLAGRADAQVTGVLVTLDPTVDAVERAASAGANLLVTHHPAYLGPGPRPTETASPLLPALQSGVALACAHTNLDRSPAGAEALPAVLGLRVLRPLEDGLQPVDVVTVFVPPEAEDAVVDSMAAAGAGRIGLYGGCAFCGSGIGRYTPLRGSSPSVGTHGREERVAESRVEMVAPRGSGPGVASAAAAAHPYDEPLIMVQESSTARGAARMGRLCATGGRTLQELVFDVACRLQVAPRALGEPERLVETVAVANGSAGSLLGAALSSSADAFLVGELRYHDALDAVAAGLCVIEVGHDASEWPMVTVLAEAVRATPSLGTTAVHVDAPGTLYWSP